MADFSRRWIWNNGKIPWAFPFEYIYAENKERILEILGQGCSLVLLIFQWQHFSVFYKVSYLIMKTITLDQSPFLFAGGIDSID